MPPFWLFLFTFLTLPLIFMSQIRNIKETDSHSSKKKTTQKWKTFPSVSEEQKRGGKGYNDINNQDIKSNIALLNKN